MSRNWRDLEPVDATSRPAAGKPNFQCATQQNPALSVIKMPVSDEDRYYAQAESELLEIKVKAVEGLLKQSHEGPKMFQAHIDIEFLKLEIAKLSQRSDKLFHLAYKNWKMSSGSENCFPEAEDLSIRLTALRTILMSIKTSSGPEDKTAVLTAQIQELRTTVEAFKKADEQKDANVNALRDEIKQLKATVAEAHNKTIQS